METLPAPRGRWPFSAGVGTEAEGRLAQAADALKCTHSVAQIASGLEAITPTIRTSAALKAAGGTIRTGPSAAQVVVDACRGGCLKSEGQDQLDLPVQHFARALRHATLRESMPRSVAVGSIRRGFGGPPVWGSQPSPGSSRISRIRFNATRRLSPEATSDGPTHI